MGLDWDWSKKLMQRAWVKSELLEQPSEYVKPQVSGQKRTRSEDQDDLLVIGISPKRRITARRWKGSILVDLREFYESQGELKPGKKGAMLYMGLIGAGISLTIPQWQKLTHLHEAITQSIEAITMEGPPVLHEDRIECEEGAIAFALDDKKRVTIRKFKGMTLVDIREFYDAEGVKKPGKKGIALTSDQWRVVCRYQSEIDHVIF